MRDRSRHAVLRAAVVRHAVLTVLVVIAVSGLVAVGVLVFAQQDAYRSAERVTRQVSSAVIVPLSDHDFTGPVGPIRARVDADLGPFLSSGMVRHVKVWTVRGDDARIVYSDERRVEGETNRLPGPDAARLDTGEILVSPVPDDAEHRFETSSADGLLEGFIAFRDARGAPSRLEVYVPIDEAGTARHTASAVLPMLLGGLVVLALATLPLSVALGRRIERERAEQRAVRHYGLTAAESSRQDLARRLHDRVIPELAGASLLLETVRAERPAVGGSDSGDLLGHAHELVTTEVRQLRALLGDLVPSEPVTRDPETAFRSLAGSRLPECPGDRPEVDVDVSLDAGIPEQGALALYGVAGELLRNAIRHARAEHVRVRLAAPVDGEVRLTVVDDGVGFDPEGTGGAGHVGLLLARRVLDDHGGRLAIESGPGVGTTVTATVPAYSATRTRTRVRSPGTGVRSWPRRAARIARMR